jgi:hypothetical protein
MSNDAPDIMTTAEAHENAALPQAHAFHCVPGVDSPECQPLPPSMTRETVAEKSEAQWAYERLVLYISDFEKHLDAEHEVGLGLAGTAAGVIRIEGMGYFAPDLLTFYGRDEQGAKMQLVQHVSQLNVMLVAAQKVVPEEAPRRIGFRLSADLDAR